MAQTTHITSFGPDIFVVGSYEPFSTERTKIVSICHLVIRKKQIEKKKVLTQCPNDVKHIIWAFSCGNMVVAVVLLALNRINNQYIKKKKNKYVLSPIFLPPLPFLLRCVDSCIGRLWRLSSWLSSQRCCWWQQWCVVVVGDEC